MEKTGEELTYVQGGTNVTRMDYASPLSNELVYSLAVERLLDLEVPERAIWIRMMLVELNRMSSHLLFQATNGMDIGAVSMMIYGWREREEVLRLLETITGLRMNHNFIRARRRRRRPARRLARTTCSTCATLVERGRRASTTTLLTDNPIWRERTVGVGVITTEEALALGATGPILRSTGFAWDLRKAQPYLAYDEVDFDVIYTENGDCYDRYRIRLYEILESIKIVRQCVERMPAGDYRVQDRKVTPPPRARIDESMEALIHHFKLFTEGFQVPAGETYVAVESPRGEIGCYLVSDGTGKPARLHIRGPSFYNLQSMDAMVPGTPGRRRGRDHLEHRPDHGGGRPLSGLHASRTAHRAEQIVGAVPAPEVGDPAAAAPRAGPGRLGDPRGDARRSPSSLGLTPALGARDVLLLHDVQARAGGQARRLGVHERRVPRERRARAPTSTCSASLRGRRTTCVEEVECLAACDLAPVLQVNYEFHGPLTADAAVDLVERVPRPARSRRARSRARRRGRPRLMAQRDAASSPKFLRERPDDSWTIDAARAYNGAYDALRKALAMTPDAIVEEVKTSGLRGRGGAGFGTGQKWSFLPKDVFPRYLVVNGDEGEPSTFKDHMLVERDPHQLIEGVIISAYAIQCHHAFIYLRGEFALGAERLQAGARRRVRATGSSARTSSAPASTSRSSCTAAPAATSPATRPGCSRASKASARCRASSRRSPRRRACTRRPRSSTTSRRSRPSRTSSSTGGEWYAAMGVNRSTGTRIFSVSGHVERPGQLRGRARA